MLITVFRKKDIKSKYEILIYFLNSIAENVQTKEKFRNNFAHQKKLLSLNRGKKCIRIIIELICIQTCPKEKMYYKMEY